MLERQMPFASPAVPALAAFGRLEAVAVPGLYESSLKGSFKGLGAPFKGCIRAPLQGLGFRVCKAMRVPLRAPLMVYGLPLRVPLRKY